VELAEDLTRRVALALDNARLYSEQRKATNALQRSLLPPGLPDIPGVELAASYEAAGEGNEVGGDFYDVFSTGPGVWFAVIGDVCGKGAEAAALTGFLRHTTVAYARDAVSPGKVLTQVNRVMLDQDFEGRFATAILVNLRFDRGHVAVTVASAGHPAALLTRRDGSACELGERGALLGVFADAEIRETSAVLEPGDSLALYTDGLLEAHAPAQTLTAREMIQGLERSAPSAASESIDALLGLVELDERVRDDIAILSARVTRAAGRVTSLNRMIDVEQSAPGSEPGLAAPVGQDRQTG
jgi:serine phosphatase RsbU (regulator of sigma subunit)